MTRSAREATAGHASISRPWLRSRKAMAGWAAARRAIRSAICDASVAGVLRNFRRAGALWNRPSTRTVVPRGCAAGPLSTTRPVSIRRRRPPLASVEVVSVSRATEAIDGSASPRNPNVRIACRSSLCRSLLVA